MGSLRSPRAAHRVLFVSVAVAAMLLCTASMAYAKTPSLKTLAKQVTALQKQYTKLKKQNASLQAECTSLRAQCAASSSSVASLSASPVLGLSPYVEVKQTAEKGIAGPNIIFHGANVHVVSGSGAEDDNGTLTGLGNLVVGYAGTSVGGSRAGSHNLIVGTDHTFQSVGALVAGRANWVKPGAAYASISGGRYNFATGSWVTVSGGQNNTAAGDLSAVSGGYQNTASGVESAVGGGELNDARGWCASVSGGESNVATGSCSSVSGGRSNTAAGQYSSVSGGSSLTASVSNAWCAGSIGSLSTGRFASQ